MAAALPAATADAPVIAVSGLEIRIRGDHGSYPVVADMALAVKPGETLCIVGESGCGKSMTALSLLRLLPEAASVASGEVLIDGEDLLRMDERQVEDLRGERIAMIFQEPLTALNPVLTIGEQIAESVRRHRKVGHGKAMARAIEMLQLVQMPDPMRRARQFPHELSGGMRQRAMIALALACDPRILVADEPTTALDVTIQAQILGLISDLQERLGTALILITHDLGVVAEVADRVLVMYAGQCVEAGTVTSLPDRRWMEGTELIRPMV